MLVDPAPGALVRDPETHRPVEPRTEVDETLPYWVRLIIDGDLVASPAAEAAPAKAKVAAPPPPAEPSGTAQIEGSN